MAWLCCPVVAVHTRVSEGHKRALWGVALGVGEKLSCGLPSRMLGTYETGHKTIFPVPEEKF